MPIFTTLGAPICSYVFDNISAGIYLSYSSWIVIPMGLSQITSSILNALNQEQKSFIYYVISSIFMVIAVLILPKFIGIKAMTYSIGISTIILSILNFVKIKKLTGYSSNLFPKLISQMLINLPIILITKLSYNWLNYFFNDFFAIAISCIISVLSYLALLFVFNIISFKNMKTFISKNFKKENAK